MPATAIINPASGESLVGTEPQLLQQVDPGWRHRLNLYTGRALSSTALDGEQIYRAGLLATLGQSVTPGIVNGLALTLQPSLGDSLLSVTPGYGLTAAGEDVSLNRSLKARLSGLPLLDPATALATETTTDLSPSAQLRAPPLTVLQYMMSAPSPAAGILVLRPVVAEVSGQLLDTGSAPLVVSGNLGASCSEDPAEFAFEDWQIADAVQLVYVPWPTQVPALSLPPQQPAATWRNRLAYAIFEAESLLGADEAFPWSMLGVPVGLIAFDTVASWAAKTSFTVGQSILDSNGNRHQVTTAGTTKAGTVSWNGTLGATTTDGSVTWTNVGVGWNPLFVDCSSVVRAGGLPRRRAVLPAQPAPLTDWQPNTAYAAGAFIIDAAGNVQLVQTAGVSGATAPAAWNRFVGLTTPDNSIVWKNNGPATWQPNTAFTAGQFIIDSQGYLEYVSAAGTSGATAPEWNGVFLPTGDGTVVWMNNGSGAQPIIQPALAQARINQLSEQLSQALAAPGKLTRLADAFATLPPSGILPVAALNFGAQQAPWLPPNWSVTAAPVRLEELETVLETGMQEALLPVSATAPADSRQLEPVEVLVPLPDAVYDPAILVVPTVAPIFQQELTAALNARNLTLQRLQTVAEELNVLSTAIGPNSPNNAALIDPDAGLTPAEIAGRDTYPPYLPAPTETFGTVLPTTWKASTSYAPGAIVIDANGALEVMQGGAAAASGASPPAWSTTVAGVTSDGAASWLNNGPWSWQPGTTYVVGQLVIDPQGNRRTVSTAGVSAAQPPSWVAGGTTPDGIVWQAGGAAIWHPDTLYAQGQLIFDAAGSVQTVQTGGISGDLPPAWNSSLGFTTQDSGVTWRNLGAAPWAASTAYTAGQAIIDANKRIQTVQVGGTSGTAAPAWNEGANATTLDGALTWKPAGSLLWQPQTTYPAGSLIIDANNAIEYSASGGISGGPPPKWNVTPGGSTTDNTVSWTMLQFLSPDIQNVLAVAAAAPYTQTYTDSAGASHTLTLLSASDLALVQAGGAGLQSLITDLSARVSAANDLLDTAFLTTQTDIYRYRENILGATAATSLATSPILANIATGDTATATAADLQAYIAATPPAASASGSSSPPPASPSGSASSAAGQAAGSGGGGAAAPGGIKRPPMRAQVLAQASQRITPPINPYALKSATNIARQPVFTGTGTGNAAAPSNPIQRLISQVVTPTPQGGSAAAPASFALQRLVSQAAPAITATDIINQSPLVGAQLNVRTLTIAQRLVNPPSQEAMFYSIANRLSFLSALQRLCNDLNLAVSDLSVIVDDETSGATTTATAPTAVPIRHYTFGELWSNPAGLQPVMNAAILSNIQAPNVPADASEATLFSVGVRVGEQHVMLLRALEARVQQYADFVTLCSNALANIQGDIQQARGYLHKLDGQLATQRQDAAFTEALLADETARVNALAAQRRQVLSSAVQLVAYTRARTLEALDTTPSRQLVPANVSNPVPACLQQSVSIPPELRELVAQLREAPCSWLPAAAAQLAQLGRPSLLQQLALDTQARASLALHSTVLPSSAAGHSGAYAAAIANVYNANSQIFRSYQAQRAAIQPAGLTALSWSLQVASVQSIAAVNDLLVSAAVHTEVSHTVARLIQQIGNVAACLYARASTALPVDRLAWADYLTGPGATVSLSGLAVLPSFNQLSYTDRQQMQMLVDWLFTQIDSSLTAASAFMSDVVRTAILLASDVPIDSVIPGSVIARILPTIGGTVSLNLPSDRVSSGMYVHLYSGSTLAARAVVADLDHTSVSATVTEVFQPSLYLNTSDVAHFTAQRPEARALRPLFA